MASERVLPLPWSRTDPPSVAAGPAVQSDVPPDASIPRPRRFQRWLAGAAFLAVALGATALYQRLLAARTLPDGLLQLNGRIEGDDITLASKVPGRVQALLVREGDLVQAGQTVASLDDGIARARLAQATAARDVAEAKVDAARANLVLLRAQVPIGIEAASAELRATEASLEQALAQEAQAGREQKRQAQLRTSGSIDDQTNERAILARDAAQQAVAAARATRARALTALQSARLGPDQVKAKEAELAALAAAARQTQGSVDEAQAALSDLTIVAPTAGTVTTRLVELGQVISAGTPLVEVVDLDRLYLKAFVPESDVGKLHIGSVARVYTDAFPERPAAATVRYVASRAEFTPKEVQTRDERVKLVYTVKLYVDDNRDRRLVPGLGADAIVRQREDAPWIRPR